MRYILIISTLFLFYQVSFAYKLISPEPFSVWRTDYVKFQVGLDKDDPEPDSIIFEVLCSYLGRPYQKEIYHGDEFHSAIFPAKNRIDTKFYLLTRIFFDGKESRIRPPHEEKGIMFLLDRNVQVKENLLYALYQNDIKDYFGKLSKTAGQVFNNNNNKVRFLSCWNESFLGFYIEVRDEHINYLLPDSMPVATNKSFFKRIWEMDGVELCFDMNNNKSEYHYLDDYEILVGVNGDKQGNVWDESKSLFMHWGDDVEVDIRIKGTVNQNTDSDSLYTMQIIVPWSAIDFQARSGDTIGFDLQNFDRDSRKDFAFRTSWSGSVYENNDNTSEWGSLILQSKKKTFSNTWMFVAAGLVILVIVLLFLISKRKKPVPEVDDQTDNRLQEIFEHIFEHFKDPELSRPQIASALGISEKYLSTFFKQKTGENLVHYINKVRINEAKELIRTSKKSISEIGYETGYNSPQHFNRVFRQIEGISPSEFRNKSPK